MATRMPDLAGTLHVQSVSYWSTFSQTTAQGGKVAFAAASPVQFLFRFETGTAQPDPQKDLYQVTWDYSWFDQDTIEAGITAALAAICQALAGMLGTTQADIEATVSIRRAWTIAPDAYGSAAPQQVEPSPGVPGSFQVTEVMAYPPPS